MLYIETGTVKGAVRRSGAQHFADRLNSAFTDSICAFDNKACRAHPYDQAMPAPIKGGGSFFDHLVCGCRTAREEPSTEPFKQVVGSNVVGRDNDHPAAPSGVDPVL